MSRIFSLPRKKWCDASGGARSFEQQRLAAKLENLLKKAKTLSFSRAKQQKCRTPDQQGPGIPTIKVQKMTRMLSGNLKTLL